MDPEELTLFYRTTLEASEEIDRLREEGHLDRLLTILGRAGLRLEIRARSAEQDQEEYLGPLDPSASPPWDHEAHMAARVEQTVEGPGGTPVEVRIPDHVCPRCGNDRHNYVQAARRRCDACDATW